MRKLVGISLLLLILSCTKPPVYPPEPMIDFLQITVKDTIGNSELQNRVVIYQIMFKVVDGDGDLGLKESDTTGIYSPDSMYHNNLFITVLDQQNGHFDTVDLPITLNYRIPYLDPVSIYDYFKATIVVDLSFDPVILSRLLDTVKFSFYVVDRSLHKSNVQETPALPIDFRGTVKDTIVIIQ